MTQLPAEIENLTNLKVLDIYSRSLIQLPAEIGNLTNLKELGINCDNLTQLSSEIGNLTNLKKLDIYSKRLIQLPTEIGNLTNLKKLKIESDWFLDLLPVEMGNLTNLKKLWIIDKGRTIWLPAEIGNLINLREFRTNPSMPGLDTYHVTKDSTIADLSNRSLEQVPFDIVEYPKLEELNLSNNRLKKLPALMIQLQNLKKIDLRGNEKIDSINKVPDEIFGIPKLETIVLTEKGKSREYNREEFSNIRRRIYEEFRELEALFNLPADSQTVLKYLAISKNKIGVSTEKIKEYEKQGKELQKRQDQKISRFQHLKAIFDKLNVA